MKDTIKEASLDTGIDISKMHGHMDIYLTDVKTGKVEEVHEDNMMTNALQEYFRNCGFLNYPNLNKSTMVVDLLGGVMGFNEEIDEDATTVRVPSGCKMIFNGSIGTLNNGNPTELGSFSETESGWQNDGSYVQTYDFSTSQANGTIACVCLTGKNYAFAGEGNSTSLTKKSPGIDITTLRGSIAQYSGFVGNIFNIDLAASTCNTFDVEDVEVGGEIVKKGVLRKYRIPASKINIKGTLNTPILLREQYINIDDDLTLTETTSGGFSKQTYGNNLLIWNVQYYSTLGKWGDGFTQYLWTITPSGNITKQTIVNTSGDDLYGFNPAYFDGNYGFFVKPFDEQGIATWDTTIIYAWNRQTNAIAKIPNPTGVVISRLGGNWKNDLRRPGWILHHGNGDGRILTCGSHSWMIDASLGEAWPTNVLDANLFLFTQTTHPLITYHMNNDILELARDEAYIASINNLDNPVVKTSEKTMKVIYRITFDEQ